jgi:serine-type D-Ala-D-Ala carboxypeptidase/endopeptidase (penicillin-binding protein 4)
LLRAPLVLALAVLLHACAGRPASTVVVAPEPPSPREQLRRDLDALFTTPSVAHAQWGVSIQTLREPDTLYSLNASRFMVPASNQKLLTTAVAAERLGWDFRFTTRVLANGTVDSDGTLTGDLVIVGNGDPTINPRHPERWHVFDAWAAILRHKGITAINGHLIGDDNAFVEPGWGVGWSWDNLQYGFGAPVGALQYHENQVAVVIGPGMEPGARAIIGTSPIGNGLFIEHGVVTAAEGTETQVDIARVPGSPLLHVRGHIAARARPVTIMASIDNPTRLFLNAFREALGRHGIVVSGNTIDIDDLRVPPDFAHTQELIVDRSAPLSEIIDVANKWSRNGYAETLLFALAPPDAPATGTRGLDAMRGTLAAWGIAPDAYLPQDGSGLSRYDYVSADMLVALLRRIAEDDTHGRLFRLTLPVAGISGTLSGRMKGTPAEGRVAAKTGSLSHVRTLSGYLTTIEGEPLVFSILVNNYRVPTADVEALVDRALVRLVQWTSGH